MPVCVSKQLRVGNRDSDTDLSANSLRKSCFMYLNMVDTSPVSHLHYIEILLAATSGSSAAELGILLSFSAMLQVKLGYPNSAGRSGALGSHDAG